MARICLNCGPSTDIDAHHIAGRRNHPLTVDVCVGCHRILSIWQRAAGIELRDAVEGTEMDATRALLVGAMHLVQLFAQRHAESAWFPNWLAIHTTRSGDGRAVGSEPSLFRGRGPGQPGPRLLT